MKGKNKLIVAIFAIMALVATGVSFAFKSKLTTIPYASAEEHAGYSAILDESVVFSAERVYIAEDRTNSLTYGGYNFNSLKTANSGGMDDRIEYLLLEQTIKTKTLFVMAILFWLTTKES